MLKTKVILLVDDDESILGLLGNVLRDIDPCIVVFTANNGKKALLILQNNDVDLVISDIFMPGMDGIELKHAADSMGLNKPFIFITGCSSRDNVLEEVIEKLGILVTKPFDIKLTISIIRKSLGLELPQQPVTC